MAPRISPLNGQLCLGAEMMRPASEASLGTNRLAQPRDSQSSQPLHPGGRRSGLAFGDSQNHGPLLGSGNLIHLRNKPNTTRRGLQFQYAEIH